MPRCGGQSGRRINKNRRRRRRRLRVATSEDDDGRFPTTAQFRELLGRLLYIDSSRGCIDRFDISAAFLRRFSDVIEEEDGDGLAGCGPAHGA